MGNSYFVPRSVKGETRILYIFTIKSFAFTVVFGLLGLLAWKIISSITGLTGLVKTLICIGIFAIVGYVIGALKIPDSPFVGPLRKAGGENVSDILLRMITFRRRKKIYRYNFDRKIEENNDTIDNSLNSVRFKFKNKS